jgi:hypothetical protein
VRPTGRIGPANAGAPTRAAFSARDRDDLEALNRLRASAPCTRLARLERRLATRFGADRRLAVYGSLAPGRANHDQLAPLRGAWHAGLAVRGILRRGTAGSAAGCLLLH